MRLDAQDLAVLFVLVLGFLVVLGSIEYLEEQLVTQVRLEGVGLGLFERDLAPTGLDLLHHVDDLEEVDHARLVIERRLELELGAEGLLRRRQDRLFQRLDQDVLVDPLIFSHLLDDHIQVQVRLHRFLPT